MVDTCSCGYYLYPLPAGAEYCSYTRHPAWGEAPSRPSVWAAEGSVPGCPASCTPPHPPSQSLLVGSPVTLSPGHCFYRLYQDLETHRLPCTSRCPRPCR